MNRKQRMILVAIMVVCFTVVLVNIARALSPEEFVVEDGTLVVREVAKTETARYAMPPVDVPEQDFPKIREIIKRGAGAILETRTEKTWQWGVPMRSTTREVKTATVFQDGTWLNPKRVNSTEKTENGWILTGLLVIIALGVLLVSMAHQKSGESKWWLVVFYGALIVIAESVFMYPAAFALLIAIGFVVFSIIAAPYSFAGVIIIATVLVPVFFVGYQIECAMFLVCVIVASYAIAKLTKRRGWIKVAEKPATLA